MFRLSSVMETDANRYASLFYEKGAKKSPANFADEKRDCRENAPVGIFRQFSIYMITLAASLLSLRRIVSASRGLSQRKENGIIG